MKYFPHLKGVLDSADVNVPININENIDPVHRDRMYSLMKSVRETGFPSISGNYDLFYFRLPTRMPSSDSFHVEKCEKLPTHRRRECENNYIFSEQTKTVS